MVHFTKIMEGVVHEGYLVKSPPEKRILKAKWRQRWFVLRHSGLLPGQFILEYFTDNTCRKAKGKIDLDQCVQVEVAVTFESKKTSYQYMFDIITPKRIYNLVAETEEDMNKWVDCICSVLGLKLYVDEEFVTPQDASATSVVSANPVMTTLPSATVSSNTTVKRSSSNPYIPISECHTGKPILHNNNDSARQKVNDLMTTVPPSSFKEPEHEDHRISSSDFYDYPRPLGAFGNNLCDVPQNDINYLVPNGSNTLPPRVNWKTYPSEASPTNFSTIPRRESVDKNDTGAYDVLPSLHSGNRRVEMTPNIEELSSQFDKASVVESGSGVKSAPSRKDQKDVEVFVPPPRPPKPPKYRDRHDYENFEPLHLKSKSDDAAAYDVPPPTKGPVIVKGSQVVSNLKKDSGNELSPSTKVPLSSSAVNEMLLDDTYDFPKFRSEDNINIAVPPSQGITTSQRQRRHAYTNAPPGLFNNKELIFNYEYRPSLMTSDYVNMDTTNKELYSALPESTTQNSGAYANVPASPSLVSSSLNGTPPAINRRLKPKRSGDKGAFNFLTLQPPPYRSKASKRSFRKPGDKFPGQAVSSTGFQPGLNGTPPGLNGTPPVPNRFRHHHEMSTASEDDLSSSGGSRRNSSNDDQARYFAYLPSKRDEIQYLDLDLDSEPSPSPKSPERVSATVYKKVDFVKTKAFNEMRQNVEESYRKSQ